MEMKRVYRENLIKNVILLIVLNILIIPIQLYLDSSYLKDGSQEPGSLLTAVSIISVLAAFGNFGFKYDKIALQIPIYRYFAHILTGLLLFVIGVCMIITWKTIALMYRNFLLLDISLFLLYLACVGYDFWDLLMACKTNDEVFN